MANPSNAIPQKVGFPQAFGSTPYQHAAQFPQFGQSQASVTNPRINEAPRSAFQVPPMSTIPPGVPQFPAMSSQTSNSQMVNGYPQNRNVAPPIARADCNGPSSAFKPYDTTSGQTVPIPPFPGPSMAPQPPINPFTPAQGVPPPVQHVTTKPLHQSTFGGPASVLYQNSSYNSNAPVGPASPPVPPALASHSSTSTSTAMQAPVSQPPAPPNLHQVQQSFSHMSINAHPAMPQQVNRAWSGSHTQDPRFAAQLNAPDLIDLTAERNVIQLGFDDNEYDLPHNMANNSARVDPSVFRCTLTVVPQTDELLKKSRLPLGLTLHPFRDMKNLNIIQTSTIVRCRYCRTYINPYVYLPDSRHWKCNLCNRNNDLPDDFCWDPNTKSFGDPINRPEIKHPTVEFIAPNEYMLRPPQPAVYVFVLDVSAAAVEAGYIYTFSEQLLINLDQLPGDDRTQVAFVCVDSMVHFYQFSSGSRRLPRELVVDEVDEMFLPSHQGILIPLKKNADELYAIIYVTNIQLSPYLPSQISALLFDRYLLYKQTIYVARLLKLVAVRAFVEKLPVLFEHASSSSNCLGSALRIVHELIAEIGGRITVFQASIPNLGPASLKPREDPNQRAANEVQNLGPVTDFYKCLALECTGHQVALDLFMLNSQYADLATLSEMAKFSTGCVYHFPNYHCLNDTVQVKRFEKILTRYLTRKIGFEAVLRIRCSRGLSLSAFYGNFFVRSTDLLALANVNPDSAIAVQVCMEEKLSTTVCFQAALLYTSSKGDRRIRVHTMCLPTTADLAQVYNNFDLKATVSLISKIGVDRSMSGSALADCREAIVNAVVDALGAYHKTMRQGRPGELLVPRKGHLRLFPLYALAMLKHTSFCAGRSVKLDDRVAAMLVLRFCPLEQILSEFYPQLYRLNEILQMESGNWPSPLPLSFEYINREGIYLIEAGSAIYLYISSHSDVQLVQDLFGCSYPQVDEQSFRVYDNPFSEKVHAFVRHVTALKFYLGPVIVVKEDSAIREAVMRRFVDDRSESTHSYVEFLQHIKREIGN